MNLAGSWRFALDRADAGMTEQWFTRDLADKIALPGVRQAQGYGNASGRTGAGSITFGAQSGTGTFAHAGS